MKSTIVFSVMSFFFLFLFCGCTCGIWKFLGPGVESELQLQDYSMAPTVPDPSHICDLCHRLWQCQILNPLSKARNDPHPHGYQSDSYHTEPQQQLRLLSYNCNLYDIVHQLCFKRKCNLIYEKKSIPFLGSMYICYVHQICILEYLQQFVIASNWRMTQMSIHSGEDKLC